MGPVAGLDRRAIARASPGASGASAGTGSRATIVRHVQRATHVEHRPPEFRRPRNPELTTIAVAKKAKGWSPPGHLLHEQTVRCHLDLVGSRRAGRRRGTTLDLDRHPASIRQFPDLVRSAGQAEPGGAQEYTGVRGKVGLEEAARSLLPLHPYQRDDAGAQEDPAEEGQEDPGAEAHSLPARTNPSRQSSRPVVIRNHQSDDHCSRRDRATRVRAWNRSPRERASTLEGAGPSAGGWVRYHWARGQYAYSARSLAVTHREGDTARVRALPVLQTEGRSGRRSTRRKSRGIRRPPGRRGGRIPAPHEARPP